MRINSLVCLAVSGLWIYGCADKAVDRPATAKFAPLSICALSKASTGLIRAEVTGVGVPEDLPRQGNVAGIRATPVSVTISEVVAGVVPIASTVWVPGDIDMNGQSEAGPLKAGGKFVSGYFFFVEFAGKSHIYGGSGFFWTDGPVLKNAMTYQGGVGEIAFLAEAAMGRSASKCPTNAAPPLPPASTDGGTADGG